MRKIGIAGSGWAVLGLVSACMSGCGGGSGGGSPAAAVPQDVRVNARIAGSTVIEGWKVCLDANQNLVCDADEPVATMGADGSYSVTLPPLTKTADRYWVAELSTAGSTAVLRLAAPPGGAVISSLSTLVAARLLSAPDAGLASAQQEVIKLLGLPADTDLLAPPGAREDGPVGLVASTAMTALQAGTQARASRAESVRAAAAAETPTQPQLIAQVVLNVLGRYADPTNGSLLPTVSSRTIASETTEIFNPTQCTIAEPLRIRIDTEDASPITSKDVYLKARLRTEASTLYGDALDVETQIRGRGNSTWDMPKKPYKLKLSKAAALLGMNSDKEWALLANYVDKSLLRNAVAFCMSRMLGLSYTPAFRYVELELNGQYQGVYQLVEHIKTSSTRIDIGSSTPVGDDPGGFLLEIDERLDADDWFISPRTKVPYTFKSDTTTTQKPLVAKLIDQFEDTLFSDDFTKRGAGGYLPLLDTESMVDFYLINELMKNNDVFLSSTFVTRKDNGPLVFGPIWDFDIAGGNIYYNGNGDPTGWWVRRADGAMHNGYVQRLFTDPAFERHVMARWKFLSRRMPALQRFIRQSAVTLDASQQRNFQTWDVLTTWLWPNAVVPGSYAGEIDYLSTWLQQRTTWMDQELATPSAQR